MEGDVCSREVGERGKRGESESFSGRSRKFVGGRENIETESFHFPIGTLSVGYREIHGTLL